MPVTIAILGCLDTKGEEVAFLRRRVEEGGAARAHIIDTGVLGAPLSPADTRREEVAERGGERLVELQARKDRGHAIGVMSLGAASIVRQLFDEGAIQGILAAGGSANSTIGTAAMRALPVGFPKVMVSTLASGDVSHYVDTKDITMMYSVVDVAGINGISSRILANAARAVVAMASGAPPETRSRPVIAATMFGVTTPCVTEARRLLEEAGYEVLVFHATGTGGRAMEGLVEDGYIRGVLDITTTELADELVGGILSAGPRRLTVAGERGVPQVVSIGAIDMVNFGPRATVPVRFEGRKLYEHNAAVTLLRTTPDENEELGRRIAHRLAGARGPTRVILPLDGVSLYSREGGPFRDPEADLRCVEALRHTLERLRPDILVETIQTDLNDPLFAQACARALLELLESGRPGWVDTRA